MTRLVCLLPVRNGEADLPGYLESVERLAEAVVALDDGSTDRTREILSASPLVEVLLENPPRPSYEGWDDSENRNRLLVAAERARPDWIVSLDVDERIDADDAAVLRRFLETDALRTCAYGVRHYRTWKGGYDPEHRWIYRLFPFEPGQGFPDQRLHFDPIPTSIRRRAWVRTSIRVRHLAADSEERVRARIAKYEQADPEGEYPTDFGGLGGPPAGEIRVWEAVPADQPVLVGPDEPALDLLPAPIEGAGALADRELVCLLPVRNGEADLPGYLESVGRFADAVVALDDGSTDRTRELLEASSLVEVLLENPPRPSYEGWDDAANRSRLLEAAGGLRPRWIISLDVNERLDAADAAALRDFLPGARTDLAYLFRVHRMIGDGSVFDRADLWVCRLFAHEPGQRLSTSRLHLVPVPASIPRTRWVRTSLRIQHLAGATAERRAERYRKYVESDPDRVFQPGYEHLLAPPGIVKPWTPRPPGLPVVLQGAPERPLVDARDLDLEGPVLSAIVISRDDEATIEDTVRSVVEQETDEPFEVIVVTSGTDSTAAVVRERFPEVTVVEQAPPSLPGAARNAGVRVARGDYVSFPGSHVQLLPGSLAARMRAHERGYPMVTGSVVNGTRTRSGWASYFLDHATALPGRPSGELRAAPAHCSYARDFLLEVGGFPEDLRAGEDTVVNRSLFGRGYVAYRSSEIRLIHHSRCRDPLRLVAHHFHRGRALGRILLETDGASPRETARMLLGYLPRRILRTAEYVRRWGDGLEREFRRALPLVALGAASAWAGAWLEVIGAAVRERGSVVPGSRQLALTPTGLVHSEIGPASERSLARKR